MINAKQEKSRTENGALRNTSINRALLKALLIQKHANLFTTEKSRSKSENLTENCIGFIFQEKQYAKLSGAFDISNVTAWAESDIFKGLKVYSATTEDPESDEKTWNNAGNQKIYISQCHQQA